MTEQFREWSDQKAKGYTTSDYQTWVKERARDKRLLAKSIGWGRGVGPKKVVMTKSAEDEVNLTAADGITPILIGTTEALPLRAAEPPGTEALPLTPEPAKEDAIMAEPAQSTPEAGPEEEPFPASTPDSSTDLLDKDGPDDFELNYNRTSSDENVGGGRDEEGSAPQEDSVAGAGSNTPEGTMTPPLPADTTPQDNLNNQHTAIRQMPSQINPPGQTETLPQPESNQKREPITIRNPI